MLAGFLEYVIHCDDRLIARVTIMATFVAANFATLSMLEDSLQMNANRFHKKQLFLPISTPLVPLHPITSADFALSLASCPALPTYVHGLLPSIVRHKTGELVDPLAFKCLDF